MASINSFSILAEMRRKTAALCPPKPEGNNGQAVRIVIIGVQPYHEPIRPRLMDVLDGRHRSKRGNQKPRYKNHRRHGGRVTANYSL